MYGDRWWATTTFGTSGCDKRNTAIVPSCIGVHVLVTPCVNLAIPRQRGVRPVQEDWAFGLTEPFGSVPRLLKKFGFQKIMTDRSFEKILTKDSVDQYFGSMLG